MSPLALWANNRAGRMSKMTTAKGKHKLNARYKKTPYPQDRPSIKRWNSIFFTNRKGRDRPFVEVSEQINEKGEPLDMLFGDPKVFGQSWEVEQTRKYLCEATNLPEGRVWVDRRIQAPKLNTRFSDWLESSELPVRLTKYVSLSTIEIHIIVF
jgi:hypothetical protein